MPHSLPPPKKSNTTKSLPTDACVSGPDCSAIHEAKGLLKKILDQEKTADDALTEIARDGNNEEARDGEIGK